MHLTCWRCWACGVTAHTVSEAVAAATPALCAIHRRRFLHRIYTYHHHHHYHHNHHHQKLVPCGTDGWLLLRGFQALVTLTLDWVMRQTIVHQSSSSTYISNFIEIGKIFVDRLSAGTRRSGHLPADIVKGGGDRPRKIQFSELRKPVTMDWVIWHTDVHRSSTSIYIPCHRGGAWRGRRIAPCCDQLLISSQNRQTFRTAASRGMLLMASATSLTRRYTRGPTYMLVLNFGHFFDCQEGGSTYMRIDLYAHTYGNTSII